MATLRFCPYCRKSLQAAHGPSAAASAEVQNACPHCQMALPQDATSGDLPASIRFTFVCQRCGCLLEARGPICGEQARCPTCGGVFIVPNVDPRTGTPLGQAVLSDDGQNPTPMHAYASAGDRAPRIVRDATGESRIQCPRCARLMPVDANVCTACGIPFTLEGAATIAAEPTGVNPLATWALTVGIAALLSSCFPVLGPVAIALGLAARSRATRYGLSGAAAGLAMAYVGIILGAVSLVAYALIWSGWFKL